MKRMTQEEDFIQPGLTRRQFIKITMGATFYFGLRAPVQTRASEDIPPEPDNLDEPTPWQEGDPIPVEMTIPAQEPEQMSAEAPPSQPLDDWRPAQPGPDQVWVPGYWWWTSGTYIWVTGYWAIPPEPDYVYIPGYWTYSGHMWVYVRGGWGMPLNKVIVVYPGPRPVLSTWVIMAPRRIVRRHSHWRHYHDRRYHHHDRPGSQGYKNSGPGRPRGTGGPVRPGSGPGGRPGDRRR